MKGEDDMYCKKCGKMIEENVQFCDSCGSQIVEQTNELDTTKQETTPVNEYVQPATQDESPFSAVPEETSIPNPTENSTESKTILQKVFAGFRNVIHGYTHFKSLSKGKKVAYIVVPIIVFVLICVSASGDGNSSNCIVKTDQNDSLGGVAFDTTFDQFIEKYNKLQDIEAQDRMGGQGDTAVNSYAQLNYLQKSQFTVLSSDIPECTQYVYAFTNKRFLTPGINKPLETFATLHVWVNNTTGFVQQVMYSVSTNISSQQTKEYHNNNLKYIVFLSIFDDGDFNTVFDSIDDDQLFSWKGNVLYVRGIRDAEGVEYENYVACACTKDSQWYDTFTSVLK